MGNLSEHVHHKAMESGVFSLLLPHHFEEISIGNESARDLDVPTEFFQQETSAFVITQDEILEDTLYVWHTICTSLRWI